jgi:hypothetical protein
VEHAAGVHQLRKNVAAPPVHSFRNARPAGPLLLVEEAGHVGVFKVKQRLLTQPILR